MRKGVKLVLMPDAPILEQVLNQSRYVTREGGTFNDVEMTLLAIRNGDAGFIPGGSVSVRIPRFRKGQYIVAFDPHQVIEIQDMMGNALRKNWDYCEMCKQMSGAIVGELVVPGRKPVHTCTICGLRW